MAQPDPAWVASLRDRLNIVQRVADGFPVSVKLRVRSGCFHREHSPHAYQVIDDHLNKLTSKKADFFFEEHESGPEIIVYLAVTTAGVTLAKSVVDLIATIIKARSEGIRKGDRLNDPVELIVRNVRNGDELREEVVFRINHHDSVSRKEVDDELVKALEKLAEDAR